MTKALTTFLVAVVLVPEIQAATIFVNGLGIPGGTGDAFGTGVNNGRLGFFSDIYFDGIRNEWWALSDRGPGGGTLSYDTRVQRFTLDINPATGAISNFKIAETVKFTNNGTPFNGMAPSPSNVLGNALDPEGLVVNPTTGHLIVSDEYGPSLYEFDRNGALVRNFTTPANLIARDGSGVPNFASDTGNVAGKTTNRGFEGLAMSPDGKYLYAVLQSAMLDEGAGNGSITRIVKFDSATGLAVAQYAYQLTSAAQGRGVSALVAVNDHEFLVLERNNRGVGVGATLTPPDKKVFKIDITGATDVSAIDLDAPGAVFTPVAKNPTPFADLAANTLAAIGNKVPEKLESLAFGPRLTDGSYFLLAGTDNDYSVTQNGAGTQFDVYFDFSLADPYASSIQCPLGQTTACFLTSNGQSATLTGNYSLLPGLLYAYKAAPSDLAYVDPFAVPEPATWTFILAGLAGVMLVVGQVLPPANRACAYRSAFFQVRLQPAQSIVPTPRNNLETALRFAQPGRIQRPHMLPPRAFAVDDRGAGEELQMFRDRLPRDVEALGQLGDRSRPALGQPPQQGEPRLISQCRKQKRGFRQPEFNSPLRHIAAARQALRSNPGCCRRRPSRAVPARSRRTRFRPPLAAFRPRMASA